MFSLVLWVIPFFVGPMVATLAVAVPQVFIQGYVVTNSKLNFIFTLGVMVHNCNLNKKKYISTDKNTVGAA